VHDRAALPPTRRPPAAVWAAVLSVAVVALFGVPILARLSAPDVSSDILNQARLAAGMVKDGGGLAYSVWYLLVYVLSGGTGASDRTLRIVAFGIVVLAVVARTLVAYGFALARLRRPWSSALAAIVAGLAMPIVDPTRPRLIYIGQISANVWHNATLLLAMPFSLLAFAAVVAYVRRPGVRPAALASLALLASTAAKPNYTLALLPVLAISLVVLVVRGDRPLGCAVVDGLVAGSPSVALLAYQYLHVFGATGVRGTHTVIAPFAVWSTFTPHIAGSLAVSVAGPVAALVAMPPSARRSRQVVLAWSTFLVALLQTSFLAEAAPNGMILTDGNYFWGSHAAIAVLMLVSITEMMAVVVASPDAAFRRPAVVIAGVVMAAHVATGAFYTLHAGIGGFPVTMFVT